MKKIHVVIILTFVMAIVFNFEALSQVAINSTGNNADATSMLDVASSTKGVLVPRMTSGERTSITSPANALLVFDTSTATFWYYDSDAGSWSELTGTAGGTCYSLEESYNCGSMGGGRTITTDYGALELTTTSSATNTDAMVISTDKGTSGTPGSGISITHSAYGTAIYGETTKSDNLYSTIQGIVGAANNNSSSTSFPSGVSGYYDGSGIGVGVWGETIGNGSSAGAGVYGLASNNNFGGHFESNSYPGINCKTNNSGAQALQIASSGASYTNPAAQFVGVTQFDISSEVNCHSAIMNNIGGEPTFAPQANGYGFLGTSVYAWFYTYTYNIVTASRRNIKRDITYMDGKLGNYIMQDIENMKPAFYKFKVETDELNPDKPSKYRPNMHMGVILDETPDYIQDNAFSGIDVYALTTLTLAGVKNLNERVKTIEKEIQDFGIIKPTSRRTYIEFSESFSKKLNKNDLPVVTVSPTQQNIHLSVEEQNKNGFYLVIDHLPDEPGMVNWIAMAKAKVKTENPDIPEDIKNQLDVPEDVKKEAKKLFKHEQPEPMELIDPDLNGRTKRINRK